MQGRCRMVQLYVLASTQYSSTVHSAWCAQYSYEYCAHHAILVRVLRAPCSTVAVQLLVPPPAVEFFWANQ